MCDHDELLVEEHCQSLFAAPDSSTIDHEISPFESLEISLVNIFIDEKHNPLPTRGSRRGQEGQTSDSEEPLEVDYGK